VVNLENAVWDDKLLDGLEFMSKSVLQVPFLLMTLMRYVTPTLDEMFVLPFFSSIPNPANRLTSFMQSIQWVDMTYIQKHKSENPDHLRAMYYPNLTLYSAEGGSSVHRPIPEALMAFFHRYAKKIGMMLGLYLLSMVMIIGRFVMPAASFYTFRNHVGSVPAAAIFGAGLILPKTYIVTFLHTYFSSRSLMRELVSLLSCRLRNITDYMQLEPYFSRVKFTSEQKRRWFRDREGVLFGFAFAFTVVLRIPYIGVLMYGVAQASTAYLVTKITDPPPPPAESENFAESQVTWTNKHDFLQLSLDNLDKFNVDSNEPRADNSGSPDKKFT
jgi:hypothetical protein